MVMMVSKPKNAQMTLLVILTSDPKEIASLRKRLDAINSSLMGVFVYGSNPITQKAQLVQGKRKRESTTRVKKLS